MKEEGGGVRSRLSSNRSEREKNTQGVLSRVYRRERFDSALRALPVWVSTWRSFPFMFSLTIFVACSNKPSFMSFFIVIRRNWCQWPNTTQRAGRNAVERGWTHKRYHEGVARVFSEIHCLNHRFLESTQLHWSEVVTATLLPVLCVRLFLVIVFSFTWVVVTSWPLQHSTDGFSLLPTLFHSYAHVCFCL